MNPEKQEDADHLTMLNDDCIFEIFDQLSLDDLCVISGTCKKLQEMAELYFQRCYAELSSEAITIEKKRGMVRFKEFGLYMETFRSQIKNVVVDFERYEMDEQLLQFMRKNCNKNIRRITFIFKSWSASFADGIKEFLQSVEVVSLIQPHRIDACFGDILNDLPHLKVLKIDDMGTAKLSLIACPRLEVFECYVRCESRLDELHQFSKENKTIKRFTCRICLYPPNVTFIKQLLKGVTGSLVEEFFLESHDIFSIDFEMLQKELRELDEHEHFKRFELRTNAKKMKNSFELATVKSLTGLHLSNLNRKIPEINSFDHLTTLVIHGDLRESVAKSLPKIVPNLKEFYYNLNHCYHEDKVSKILLPFVRHSKHLVKFVFIDCRVKEKHFNITKLCAERKKKSGATKLTIYLAPNTLDEIALAASRSNEGDGLVTINWAIKEYSQEPDLKNPLISFNFSRADI